MPMMLQTEVDGTKSKVSGLGLSQGNMMGGGDGSIHSRHFVKALNKKSVVGAKQKRAMEKQDSDLEIIGTISGDEPHGVEFIVKKGTVPVGKLELEINTSVNSSDDNLDLDIIQTQREPKGIEEPVAHSTKLSSGLQPRKIVVQKKQKEKVEPINLKVSKCTGSGKREVFSEIPVLQPRQKPCGKSGKSNRIISAEVRENEKALLALLEEADNLSSNSGTLSDDDTIVKKHKINKKKGSIPDSKRIKYSLEKIKTKLAE